MKTSVISAYPIKQNDGCRLFPRILGEKKFNECRFFRKWLFYTNTREREKMLTHSMGWTMSKLYRYTKSIVTRIIITILNDSKISKYGEEGSKDNSFSKRILFKVVLKQTRQILFLTNFIFLLIFLGTVQFWMLLYMA